MLLRHHLPLSRKRMRLEVWRPELILMTKWKMIFISLLSRRSTHLLTVNHPFLLLIHQSHHRCPHTLSRHVLSSLNTIHHSPILVIPHLLRNLLYMSFRLSLMLYAWTFMPREMILLACVDQLMRARICMPHN